MHINLRPGFVYIMFSPKRPGEVKIGKALSVEQREHDLALADPDFKLFACKLFLDVFAAETTLHHLFKDQALAREHFKVSKATALRELERLHTADQLQMDHLTASCRFMADVGALKLDASQETLECNGSALSTVLSYVPNARDSRNVKTLTMVALSDSSASSAAMKLLHKCGLIPYRTDGLVLFDRAGKTVLEKLFKGKPCATTWREQLARYAGINENGVAVSLKAWLDRTEANSNVVDRVYCPA